MAGLVETDQHGSRSRSGGRNHDSNRSGTTRTGAREREARKELETKRRTARANVRDRLASARHQRRTKTHAARELRVAHASRVLASASSRSRTFLNAAPGLKTRFNQSSFRRDSETRSPRRPLRRKNSTRKSGINSSS